MLREFRKRLLGKGVLIGGSTSSLNSNSGFAIESNAPGGTLIRNLRYYYSNTAATKLLVEFFDSDALPTFTPQSDSYAGNLIGVGTPAVVVYAAVCTIAEFLAIYGNPNITQVSVSPDYVSSIGSHWHLAWDIWIPTGRTLLAFPDTTGAFACTFSMEAYDCEGPEPTE